MKLHHGSLIVLCFLSACSTHPLADFCDYACPGKLGPTQQGLTPYGGVGIPQGPIIPASPTAPGVLGPGPVVPPPVPLPGMRPGIQVQPPTPLDTVPPLPPTPPAFPRG
jgi:hypothetical protein